MGMSYTRLTLKQFIEINRIPKTWPKIDQGIHRLSIIHGKPVTYYESIPLEKLSSLISKTAFLDQGCPSKVKEVVWIKGVRYKLKKNIGQYSAETYLSLKAYSKDVTGNIHHVLSWLYEPSFTKLNREKAANDFLNHGTVADFYGAFFLFSRKLQRLKVVMEYSVLQAEQILNDHLKEVVMTLSKEPMAGITP